MQPITVTRQHLDAVRNVEGILRAHRGRYVSAHKIFLDAAGAGTMTMALYRDGSIARWYAGDTDEPLGLGAAESARKLIATHTSN
ncbi:hypothetical protein CWT12_12330 [Actinomyces sp. 432]|uniref:hypothetical protein n=1 Tax=Actinomyces sp. 432 TaxID=2057798 RepID=UPI0013745FE8|nr:hypothetical protein [Actinomyces sp. 432]QHO91939.1 hypothetical protein CWT12_12330 [Actinomyces sp. 432]